ncbi:hypothetical protein HYT00_02325 [Candidatus Giovannonibacteria bacterium]|nr:hypothetical protein [Candidatus Giovannonibacteria bacterium]
MNKTRNKLFITSLSVALFLAPAMLFGAEIRANKETEVRSGETVNNDLYAGGGIVNISGNVTEDLYAGGGNVFVNSNIGSDAVIGGGNITVLGNVGDDLRVGGGSIFIQAAVGDDLIVGGGQVQIEGPKIGGDLIAGGGVVRVNAPVEGNVQIGGGEVYINSPIKGNVEINADKLILGGRAVINGNLKYRSPNQAVMEQGSVVRGTINYTPRKAIGRTAEFSVAAALVRFLMLLFGALVFGLLFRRYSGEIVRHAHAKPLLEIGRGLIILIVLPIISIILFVTVIGIPLGIFGLLSFILMMIYSVFMSPVILGSLLKQWIMKDANYSVDWKSILLGVAVIVLLGIIPILGWIIQAGFVLLTLGTTMRLKWNFAKEWR